jgi:hypothetical protein
MKYLILILMFSTVAMAKDESPNKMICEQVHGDQTINGGPNIKRCENKKEVCFYYSGGLSCYPKPKE